MQFRAFEPGIEVNGQTIYAVVDGFAVIKTIPSEALLAEGIGTCGADGIVQVDPAGWYSQQAWLRAFEAIAQKAGEQALFAIGRKIPENAKFPPWVRDIDSAVRSIDVAYHMNHRKAGKVMFNPVDGAMLEGIGHYGFERVPGEDKIVSRCNNPYPCAFDRGIVTSMARRFEPRVVVRHEDPARCRAHGAESCTYVVTW